MMDDKHHRSRHCHHERYKRHGRHHYEETYIKTRMGDRSYYDTARPPTHTYAGIVRDSAPLSNDKEYIHNWLRRTEAERSKSTTQHEKYMHTDLASQNHDYRSTHHAHSLSAREGGHRHQNGDTHGRELEWRHSANYSSRKRRRSSSMDSSVLEYPVEKVGYAHEKAQASRPSLQPASPQQRHLSSERDVPDVQEVRPEQRKETFDKRARHKTREDRYDVKSPSKSRTRRKDEAVPVTQKKARTKKVQKHPLKTNSARLMQEFTSEKISQDQGRLTVREHNAM